MAKLNKDIEATDSRARLKAARPDIYDDIRFLPLGSALREAGRRLGVAVPAGSPFSIAAKIAEAAEKSV